MSLLRLRSAPANVRGTSGDYYLFADSLDESPLAQAQEDRAEWRKEFYMLEGDDGDVVMSVLENSVLRTTKLRNHQSAFLLASEPIFLLHPPEPARGYRRGQFVDIHAIDGPDPNSYDVLIKDVDEKILRSDIAKIVGVPYLGEDTESDVNTKVEACKLLNIKENIPTSVTIAGYVHPVYTSPNESHFSDINILGMDFFNTHRVQLWFDYDEAQVKLYFGENWRIVYKD
ncbi:MAG: hypothetical protein M1813_007022 [Trichoglossum hirsutum]|nr:MAG: hypothetical protein M1813_007022 [Trichoglossum hirsutum]